MADAQGGNPVQDIPLQDVGPARAERRRVRFDLPNEGRWRWCKWYYWVVLTLGIIAFAGGLVYEWCTKVNCMDVVQQQWYGLFNPDEEAHRKIKIPRMLLSPVVSYWRHRDADHDMPRILLWDPPSWKSKGSLQVAPKRIREGTARIADCASMCRRSTSERCEVTHDRDLLKHCDAVVFKGELFNAYELPPERTMDQKWVFWVQTAQLPYDYHKTTFLGNDRVAALFNWSMAYRDDADIHFPLKIWRYRLPRPSSPRADAMKDLSPRRSAALIVGACSGDRIFDKFTAFSSSLATGEGTAPTGLFHLHVLHQCGEGVCSSLESCVAHIAERYHFIFVHRFSDCYPSIYDVIFEAFKYDLVPVLLGPPNVTTVDVPPHSIVHSGTLGRKVPLSSHLQSLLNDPRKYKSFFSWKKDREVVNLDDEMCPLCCALWEFHLRAGMNGTVRDWLDNRDKCRSEDILYGLDRAFQLWPPV